MLYEQRTIGIPGSTLYVRRSVLVDNRVRERLEEGRLSWPSNDTTAMHVEVTDLDAAWTILYEQFDKRLVGLDVLDTGGKSFPLDVTPCVWFVVTLRSEEGAEAE